jgi:hypothetical protein
MHDRPIGLVTGANKGLGKEVVDADLQLCPFCAGFIYFR